MKIEGNKIIFISDFNNYQDEENGKKPNTARILNRADAEEVEIWWQIKIHSREIEIHGTRTGLTLNETKIPTFKRKLTDISDCGNLLGHHIFVFSWKHEA